MPPALTSAPALPTRSPAFPLPALAASAQIDRTHVDSLWTLLSTAPADLLPLHDDLTAVADVAAGGREVLIEHDTARVLDPDLGDEDCAAIAFLDHRALFDAARPKTGSSQVRRYGSYEARDQRPFPEDPSHRKLFIKTMSAELDGRSRSTLFRMHEHVVGTERHMELVYGRLASTRDIIGKAPAANTDGATNGSPSPDDIVHDVTDVRTDRSTERARAVFHHDTMRLDVAGPDWIKELVRRVFGIAYFGSADHFQGVETLTLDPLAHLESALATHDVPGLKRVDLQEVCIDLADGSGWMATGARNDCTKGATGGYALRGLSDGTATEATFLLHTTAKTRPVKLTLTVPRKLDFDRRDPRVVRIVRDWVVAAGYMRMPSHLVASGDALTEIADPSTDVAEASRAMADAAPAANDAERAEDRSG